MSLRKTPFEFVTVQPRRMLLGGLFASLAVTAVIFGLGSTVAMSPTPAQACESGCGGSGGDDNNDHHGHEDDNDGNCGGCGNDGGDGGGDDGGDGGGDDGGDSGGDDGGDSGGNDGGNTGGNTGGGAASGSASIGNGGDNDTYELLSREVNNYTRGNRLSSAHYNILGDDFRGSRSIRERRVVYVRPRRVVRVERPRRVVYVQPRPVQVIRPRIVRELRPSYRTGYAVRAGRYENVVYTAPAVRYGAPAAVRRVVYSDGYASGRVPAVTAYAARGRVGVRAVESRVRGRGVVRSLSAYAQGRDVRVSVGGSRIYGNVAPRAYASESYVYADESGADIVYAGQRYRTTVYGGRYGSRGGLYGAAGCEYRCY